MALKLGGMGLDEDGGGQGEKGDGRTGKAESIGRVEGEQHGRSGGRVEG